MLIAAFLLESQYLINKGPNDVGAMWSSFNALQEQFGRFKKISLRIVSFRKLGNANQGDYEIAYIYNKNRGAIKLYYDGNNFQNISLLPSP